MSAAKKPVSLLGRLAVQLKMITMEQLREATAEQGRHPEKRLGDIFLELGHVSDAQLAKLEKVQRDVIAKHRAKKAAAASPLKDAERVPSPEPVAAAPEPAAAPSDRALRAAPPLDMPDEASAPSDSEPAAAKPEPIDGLDFAIGGSDEPEPSPAVADDEPSGLELATPEPPAPDAPVVSAERAAPPQAEPAPAKPPAQPAPAAPPQQAVAPAPPVGEHVETLELTLGRGDGDQARLHQILSDAVSSGASDIHIHAGAPLKMRVHGRLAETGGEVFSVEQAEQLALAALGPAEQEELARAGEIDACVSLDGIGRFRLNAYRQQRGFDIVLRAIPAEPPTLEDLGLPNALARFTNYHQGMVLLTGPAGCGKSATMAALVNMINEERDEHILTVEDPIEYVHKPKRCLVNQRHAGRHTGSFARALRAALREDPDVIVIGELRDLETISLAMTAAETGHFVLATLHTANAVRTINRMIGAFPSNRQDQVRTMLSESLRAVISQRLVPTVDGSSRVPALELLVINKAISNLIRDEKTVQIKSAIQTGAAHGMYLLEQSLGELARNGTIDMDVALKMAEDKKLLQG